VVAHVVRLNGELQLHSERHSSRELHSGPALALLCLDPDTATEQRMANEDARHIGSPPPGLMAAIDAAIRRENWMARAYRTAGERLEE